MREEKADLRAQVYMMEKEKRSLELTVSSQQAQELAMKTHIEHLQDELENQDSLVIIYRQCVRLNGRCKYIYIKLEHISQYISFGSVLILQRCFRILDLSLVTHRKMMS